MHHFAHVCVFVTIEITCFQAIPAAVAIQATSFCGCKKNVVNIKTQFQKRHKVIFSEGKKELQTHYMATWSSFQCM